MFIEQPQEVDRELTFLFKHKWKKILEAAVKVEEQSIDLYNMALENTKYPSSKVFLKQLVDQEKGHKKKLEAILDDESKIMELGSHEDTEQNLKIVDMMKDTPLTSESDYKAILIYAAKREKSTYDYYKNLAMGLKGTQMGKIFNALALEELGHKTNLEKEYDDCVLQEN
jgi:rubrerythrin